MKHFLPQIGDRWDDLEDSAIRSTLSFYAKATMATLIGVVVGLMSADFMTARNFPFGGAQSGPWISWSGAGSLDPDPYMRAIIARRGLAPLGNAEGVEFFAMRDSDQRPLNGACDYIVSGAPPAARFWTLSTFSPSGAPVSPDMGRRFVTSSSLLRNAEGAYSVIVAPSARAGNWLASAADAPFTLVLRLYDANVSLSQSSLEELPLPQIHRQRCAK